MEERLRYDRRRDRGDEGGSKVEFLSKREEEEDETKKKRSIK